MIRIEIDRNKNRQEIEIRGTTADVLTDITFAINQMYNSLLRNEPIIAEGFRHGITRVVQNGLMFQVTDPGKEYKITEVFMQKDLREK